MFLDGAFSKLFELRVFKQLGIVVNTIVKITLRTAWFLVVMALFLVGFTHALLHLLHTQPASGSAGKFTLSNGTGYPTSAPLALSATYFFLGGRWDPLDQNFDGDEGSFHVMMFIFFFFTAILLLNLLIALMNDAYNDSQQEGEQAWLRQWSVIIANVEKTYLSPSEIHNSNTFPDFVYYGAPEEEAEAYESKFAITSKANLSIENQFLIDQFTGEQRATLATHRSIQRDVSNLQQSYERLRRTQESVQKNMLTITALVGHCYRILGSPSQETPADETADGENPAEVEDGETDEEEEEEEEYDEDDGGQLEEGLEYEQDQDEGLVYEDENENSNAGADIEEMVDIDPDRKKPVLADTETNVDPYSKEKKSSQQAEERMPRPHARMRKSSQHAEERKTSRITEDDKGSIDLPAPASTIPTPTPPLLSSPSSSGPRPTPGFSRTAPQQVPPPMADSNARPPPPSSLPTPSSSAGPPPPAPGFSRKAPQHPPLPSSGAIVQPPLPAPPLPVSAITAPSADPVLPPPPQSASPITASPTELEQGGSPMPIAERIPVHDPSSSRLKKKTTATTPARAPPRNAPTAPGRVTHSPADTDPLSSPYGAHPAQPSSRVPFDHGQLPGPSMSMPVLVGDNASGWPAYLPPSQQHRPQAQWNPITNPAEMQARIESSYLRRKKRKNVTKAGAGGAATDASSAAEDDATSLRSLPLETPAASSSSSQVRQRNRRREAGGSSSAPSSRRLDQRELSGRRMTDSATTGSTPVQRSPLAESRVRQRDDDDAQEQHRIEYLDMEDENAI
ncbi:hypothetical protein BGZ73_002699 [Actinomortierella ambigua]|nr:hypothetical protein BGZ73_002699 [Actinomortierella ambigua]